MKRIIPKTIALAVVLTTAVAFLPGTAQVHAQNRGGVGQLVSGLLNVVVGVNVVTGDITLNDVDVIDIDTINVEDVLNNNEIRVLSNILNNNRILNNLTILLTDVLQNNDILSENQVVVGILNIGGVPFFVIQDV